MPAAVRRIVVAGMHRSGTSLVAQIVRAWGASAGRDDELARADEHNPDGYWEHAPLVQLNDDLLRSLGACWFCPPPDAEALVELSSDAAWRARALDLLERMDAAGTPWLWKDPRLAATLPFWRPLLGEAAWIVTVRRPIETARSLAKRDRFPVSASLLLWQVSMTTLLVGLRGSERVLPLDYDGLVDAPDEPLSLLASFLDEHCGEDPDRSRLEAMRRAVKPALHRQRDTRSLDEVPQATDAQIALEAYLRALVRGDRTRPFDAREYPLSPGWREYLDMTGLALGTGAWVGGAPPWSSRDRTNGIEEVRPTRTATSATSAPSARPPSPAREGEADPALEPVREAVRRGALDEADRLLDEHAPASAESKARALALRGDVLAHRGRPEEALDAYDLALALRPDLAGARLGRGAALLLLDRPDESSAEFERVLALDGHNPRALAGCGLAARRRGDLSIALGWLVRALREGDPSPETIRQALEVAAALGRFEPVVEPLRAYVTEHGNEAHFGFALAAVLCRTGREDEAAEACRRVLEIAPGHPETSALLGSLTATRGDGDRSRAVWLPEGLP